MRTITFNVNQQKIRNTNSIAFIYGKTHNYLKLDFKFSTDWDDCVKAISFGTGIKPMLLTNNSCLVPAEAFNDSELSFYLVGKRKDGYRIESQIFNIRLGG